MNTPLVEFVGAGPGAEDLITLRGLRALEQADLVVYAGSLVNPGHLKRCKPDCECRDSAAMNLGEQVAAMSEAALAGKRVVRLHTGDPAMYGAINEQIRALAEKGIASRIVPGVSSVFGAAAALGCELTCPDVSQSVVLTRTPGRTPMPKGENAAAFARTGATLVFFLSTGKIDDLMTDLMGGGGCPRILRRGRLPCRHGLTNASSGALYPTSHARSKRRVSDGRRSFSWAGRWMPKAAHHGFMALTFHMVTETTLPTKPLTGAAPCMPLPTRGLSAPRKSPPDSACLR